MSFIRVDPAGLRLAAIEVEQAAEKYRGLAERVLRVGQAAPSYDGQFGQPVREATEAGRGRLIQLADRLTEQSEQLVWIAKAFEEADAQTVAGLLAMGWNVQQLIGAGLTGLTLSALRPPHISEAVWNRLPLEDRLAILEDLGLLSATSRAGKVMHVLNPLRIRREPGLNGEIRAYARPGSEVTHTGSTRTVDGVAWYQVSYQDPIMGVVIGWVSSYYLSTGRSRVGYDPKDVRRLFDIDTDFEVWDAGGRLMSVESVEYLQIRDGPTNDYAAPEAVQWGQVVRWTGNSIEAGGHTWYQVTTWAEQDGGKVEPYTGWARADRVQDYVPDALAPDVLEDGRIWVQLPGLRSFSQYNLYDVDSYVPPSGDFARKVEITWSWGIGPEGVDQPIEVPYGALYGPDGVAMQGSGVVPVEVIDPETQEPQQQKVYFTLNNPDQLDWKNEHGDPTSFGQGGWENGRGVEIANPELAEFRVLPEPPKLRSGFSAAGPPEYRGHLIWAPNLMDPQSENPQAVFEIEDAGGFFPPGSMRFDLYIEDPRQGFQWYQSAPRLNNPVYVDQPIPPGLEAIPPELLPSPPESDEPPGP